MEIIKNVAPPVPDELMQKARELYDYIEKSSDTPLEKLSRIYDYLTEFSLFAQTFSKCSKGCSACCAYGVSITTFEAKYISLKTGIEYSRETVFAKNDNADCPFLGDSGECSIYNCRPIICRMVHTLGDPKNCEIGVGENQVWYGSQGANFSNSVYSELIQLINIQNLLLGGDVRDIRFFFPYDNLSLPKSLLF